MKKFNWTIMMFLLLTVACKEATPKESSIKEDKTDKLVTSHLVDLVDITKNAQPIDLKEKILASCAKVDQKTWIKKQKFIQHNNVENTLLTIWYSQDIPLKIEYSLTNDLGEFSSSFKHYLKEGKPWFSTQKFANFLFTDGQLSHWTNENWEKNSISPSNFSERNDFLTKEINDLLSELSGESIFYDEQKKLWMDHKGICHTCNFENGFNPNGWLLSSSEQQIAQEVLQAELEYGIDLKHSRISSKEMLKNNIEEYLVEDQEQNQKFVAVDFTELNQKLAKLNKTLSPKEVMEMFYPITVDENSEGNESISISKPRVLKNITSLTLLHSNLLDDSVKDEKYHMSLTKIKNQWQVVSLEKNWTCRTNRGHQYWGIENCK